PAGSSVALVNDPGVEAEPFLYQSCYQHLHEGRTVIYGVFNRPPSAVLRGLQEYGFDIEPYKARLHFLDAFSPLMGASENARYTLRTPADLGRFRGILEQIHKDQPDAVLILDSLSTLIDNTSLDAAIQSLTEAHDAMKSFPMALALLTRWPYGDDFTRLLATFDCVISLRGVEDRVLLNQYFMVDRAAWSRTVDHRPVLYKAIKPGGVFVYIPKVVVTGPYHAGKSTFVQTLSDTAVSVNRLGTTVALDHGHLTIDGLTADIFGTPGQERFDPLLKTIAGQALGVIVVVDSTRPDTLPRAKDMMELTGKQGLPMIIAANKQDAPGALTPAEIAKRLNVPPHIRVIGCTGQDKTSAQHVLRELLNQIMTKVVG
ncbi:MAG TPA: GTP-binding protein, partial [Candidatus Thermoplasmatota archaeon]|nr:GTP-binding protein [Candidatus Thermoplasmatota archaeon]